MHLSCCAFLFALADHLSKFGTDYLVFLKVTNYKTK